MAIRRTIPLIALALSLVLATLFIQHSTGAGAQEPPEEIATGVVFHDLNENGVRDPGEPGVPGVSVSNGRDVVQTDADGAYSLSVDDHTVIFITKPAGYMVPVNEVQLPQFYYLHYPDGSVHDTHFPGIEPTGPLPESVDFPIYEYDEPNAFEAVVFADPQTRNNDQLDRYDATFVEELTGTDAHFGMTMGDIVHDDLDLFERHNELTAKIGIPWWNLPGNHDINFDVPDDEFSTDTYKSVFGPADYSYSYGDVHFVHMDNVDYFGQDGREGEPLGSYRGYLNETQLEWLANDLSFVPDDKLLVIGTHIPLRIEAIGGKNINLENLDELFEVLEGRDRIYTMAGHDSSNMWRLYMEPGELRPPPPGAHDLHRFGQTNEAVWEGETAFLSHTLAEVNAGGSAFNTGPLDERGFQQADMSDGTPSGYYIVSFEGNEYKSRFKAEGLPEDYQFRITFQGGEGNVVLDNGDRVWIPSGSSGVDGISPAPQFHPRDWSDDHGPRPMVEVNVFDGGVKHDVELRVNNRPFTTMDHNPPLFGLTDGEPGGNLDPYITALRQTLEGSMRPVNPQPSGHLWTQTLPNNLGPGNHTVTVRVTDPYGEVYESSQDFVIQAGRP